MIPLMLVAVDWLDRLMVMGAKVLLPAFSSTFSPPGRGVGSKSEQGTSWTGTAICRF